MKLPPITVRIACFCEDAGGSAQTGGFTITRVAITLVPGFGQKGERKATINLALLLDSHEELPRRDMRLQVFDPTGIPVCRVPLADFDPENNALTLTEVSLQFPPINQVSGAFNAVLLVGDEPVTTIPIEVLFGTQEQIQQH